MSTDRELLEAAARAAVVELEEHEGRLYAQRSIVHKREWNPLQDDGDALRLAVKLDLLADGLAGHYVYKDDAEYAADPYAATRRAIVRAAAAMAKDIK